MMVLEFFSNLLFNVASTKVAAVCSNNGGGIGVSYGQHICASYG